MKKFGLLLLLTALCTVAPAHAQTGVNAQTDTRAQTALPADFAGWKILPIRPEELTTQPVLPESAVSTEAGRTREEMRRYGNGNKQLTVSVQEYKDPSGAYEVYTSLLNTKLNPSTVAPLTAAGNDRLIGLVGNRIVTIEPIRGASDAALKLLLDKVRRSADASPLPPVRGYLPDEDMVQGSQRYALGPAGFDAALQSLNEGKFAALTPEIGFNKGAEAVLAGYHSATGKTETLILVEYPTPQIAEQQLKHMQPILAGNADFAGASVERKNSLLSLVLNPANAKSAASLRENVKYGIAVTWNEGSHALTDPPWLVTVKNIFVGTLAFCGIAIVLGVAFGGVRVVTKKLFPGKVFDRHRDREVLQLGLSGKRIDPTDFY